MRVKGLSIFVLGGLFTLSGCAEPPPLPEYATVVDETNAAMREIADLLPLTTADKLREGNPFTCGNMFEPSGPDTPVFYTGNLTLEQPPGFDAEAFIKRLPKMLSEKYESRRPDPEIDDGTTLYLSAMDGTGPAISVSAHAAPGEEYVYILATSRCAEPEPPEVATAPLPDYGVVRDEAVALTNQVADLLPPGSAVEYRDGWDKACEEMTDPFTDLPPRRHGEVLEMRTPEGFDGAAFIASLPTLLGDDFELAPPDTPDGHPKVNLAARKYGGALVGVTAWDLNDGVLIVVESRCAVGEPSDSSLY